MFKVTVAIETSYTRSKAWRLPDEGYTQEGKMGTAFFTTNCFTGDMFNIAFIFIFIKHNITEIMSSIQSLFPCTALILELFFNTGKDSAIKSHILSLKCTS